MAGVQTKFVVWAHFLWAFCAVCSADVKCVVEKPGNGTTVADCRYRHLTSVPSGIFLNVTDLSVSHNHISVLREGTLSKWVYLTRVDFSHNVLHQIDQRAFHGLGSVQSIDLSYNHLTFFHNHTFDSLPSLQSLKVDHNEVKVVHHDTFQGLPHLLYLDLGNNQLQVLTNDTFSQLQHLTWLAVGSNRLDRLEARAFFGLHSLTNLDMSNNALELLSSVFPPHVFSTLSSLQILRLQLNDDALFGDYPVNVFCDLVSLRYLAIDTFSDMDFGQNFSALRHIDTLDLSNDCKVNILYNTSLGGFKNSTLSELFFSGCTFQRIETCAFCDLPALKRLRFTLCHTSSPVTIMESFYGLQHQTMSEIVLEDIGDFRPLYVTVDHHVARYLRNICVSTLKMVNCNIQRIVGNAMVRHHTPLVNCIEHADLSQNSIIGDSSTILQVLTMTQRLRTLSLQDQQTFSLDAVQCLASQHYRCVQVNDANFDHSCTAVIPTPANLTYFNISSLFPHLNPLPYNITFPSATNLQTLDVSYLGLAKCQMTIYGLQNLETLNINGNFCNNFTDTAFDYLSSLTTLSLSSIGLDQHFVLSRAWRVFSNLTKLQVLDLSLNNLVSMDPAMLHTQTRLKELRLAGNRFQTVPVVFNRHPNLMLLDLSHNMLTTLTPSDRQALDSLALQHHVSLRLRGNPLACSCFNLDMVQWLWHTAVSLDGEGHPANYTCTTETGEVTSTERVMVHWISHWRTCVGVQSFHVTLSAFLAQILGVIIMFLVARSWTQLYYAWRAIRNLHMPRRDHFQKDAYVVYADVHDDVNLACVMLRECLEERYGVRLLLPNRDEIPGNRIAENIVQHIENSWKILLLVTLAFSEDGWACGFAVQQAQRSITDNRPDRVIIVFLEDPEHLPVMPSLELLLQMVPEKNILYIRPRTPAHHDIWRVLAELILEEPRD